MSGKHAGASHPVRRYSGSARINHWVVAISFVALMLSGLAFFYPVFYPLTALFGGGSNARMLHPWIGIVMAVSFLGLFFRFFVSNLPELTDFVWVARLRHVLAARDEYLPEVGKYNAGQKFVFWSQFILVMVMLVTGLGLWEPGLAFAEQMLGFKATIDQRRMAALLHASAAVASIAVWIIHVHAAFWVRGTLSAMTRGTVSGGWAWRHHRKWLRREVAKDGGAGNKNKPQPAE